MAESDEFCMKIIHFSYFYPDLKPFAYKAVLRAEQFMRRILNCGYLEYFSFEKLSIILQEMDTYYNRICNTDAFYYQSKNNLFYVTDGGEAKVYNDFTMGYWRTEETLFRVPKLLGIRQTYFKFNS